MLFLTGQDLRLDDSARRILYSGNLKRKPDDKDYEVILLDHLLVLARPSRKNKYDEQLFEICHDVCFTALEQRIRKKSAG